MISEENINMVNQCDINRAANNACTSAEDKLREARIQITELQNVLDKASKREIGRCCSLAVGVGDSLLCLTLACGCAARQCLIVVELVFHRELI